MPKDAYVRQRCAEIETALHDSKAWSMSDAKLGAYLAGYLTVLICGMVEDCIEHLMRIRASRTNDREIENFVAEVLRRRFGNPDHQQLVGVLSQFSDVYASVFKTKIPHNGNAASALRSIVGDKNMLAHSGVWKLQTTVSDVENYYVRIVPILEALEDILLQ